MITAIQASILCLYNSKNDFTIQEIMDKTAISQEELKQALMRLCNPKTAILNKAIKKPTFDDLTEKISLNFKFDN